MFLHDASEQIVNDAILPSQWRDYHVSHNLTPLQRLMYAVLVDSLRELVRFRLKSPTHLRAIEVEDWLRADHEGPFTFESICDELKVDVEFLRRLALSGDRMQVPRRSCNGRNHTVPINLLRRAYGNGK